MRLTWHRDIHSFLEQTLDYLEAGEAVNNLMLGIALRAQREPGYYQAVELMTLSDEEGLVVAALMTVPEKLILYSPLSVGTDALERLATGLIEKDLKIPGVVGPKELVETFVRIWKEKKDCLVELDMHMRVYELREVNQKVIGAGHLRLAGEDDLEFLIEGVGEFMKDATLDAAPDLEKCTELARRRLADQSVFLWEYQGKVVSMAAKSRPTRHGVTVNLVYTPKKLRGRGYATSCVASLSQKLLDGGYEFCSLFTDLANPTSNSIYQKIGYRSLGDFDGYYFRGKIRCCTTNGAIVPSSE